MSPHDFLPLPLAPRSKSNSAADNALNMPPRPPPTPKKTHTTPAYPALSDEPPGLRATLQEAVGSLAVAYKDLPAAARSEVDGLLLESITNGKVGVSSSN